MKSNGFSAADRCLADRICLGTVQFGTDYGIANKAGKPSTDMVFDILDYARSAGIRLLDTASDYGNSESLIGKYIAARKADFKIITKMAAAKNNSDAEKNYRATLEKLHQPRIYGYLVRSTDLDEYGKIRKHLETLREKQLVEKIGVSLYKTGELDYLLDSRLPFDIIQVPYSIFDQRFDEYFPVLKKMDVEIYSRSAFLQGLFFLDEDRIAENFTAASTQMAGLRRLSAENDIPIPALCLCFAALNSSIDKIVIGVDSTEQIKTNMESLGYMDRVNNIYNELKALKLEDEEILLPYNWK